MGVSTDDGGADLVLVHMVSRVVSHSFVRTPRRCFVGAAVRVHTGKDGHVRQLRGPGITTLQGCAKKVHVQPQRAPSRVEKKVVTPKCKLMWRRKEAPSVVSSQAGQAGECGVVGKQDLKMANMRGVIVDIPPPFRADPHALGQRFLGGEDDMGSTEEVKPNFRSSPR
jgi:hypothetical protein